MEGDFSEGWAQELLPATKSQTRRKCFISNGTQRRKKDLEIYPCQIYKNLYNAPIKIKPLKFIASSLDDLRNFPDEARRAGGFELHAIQTGLEPSDWKPIQVVGSGVKEIRIHILGEWRVIHVAKHLEAVYVLHAFQKKTQKTSRKDIDLARQRYKQIGG